MEGSIFRIAVDFLLAGIGIFAIVSGIIKKGTMFRNAQVDDEKRPAYNKRLSLFLIISGIGLIGIVGLDYINISDAIRLACYGVVIAWFAYFGITTRKYMKK